MAMALIGNNESENTPMNTLKTGSTGQPMTPTTGSVVGDKAAEPSVKEQISDLLDQIGDWRDEAWDEMDSMYGDRDKFRDLIVSIGRTAKKIADIHDSALRKV